MAKTKDGITAEDVREFIDFETEEQAQFEPKANEEKDTKSQFSDVLHPEHYCGAIETKDFIKDKLGNKGYVMYCIGNVIKYISRFDKKGSPLKDLEKAMVYLSFATEIIEGNEDKFIPKK